MTLIGRINTDKKIIKNINNGVFSVERLSDRAESRSVRRHGKCYRTQMTLIGRINTDKKVLKKLLGLENK